MYECPNCYANLKYHIGNCSLYCDHCGTTMSPYLFEKEQDAEERTEYEVTVFSCPQCGGELISDDTTAATFCSYCGSSTVLHSRLHREKFPKYIIPFSKTEEDCRTEYKKMMKKAIFAPKELKDDTYIQKFRGIYMPYWIYSFEKNGPITFTGSQQYRSGDYIITSYYKIHSDLEAEYSGIAFDASSTFCDSISEAIAPFDIKKGKPFTPSFLSGFYADTNDVDQNLYISDAEQTAVNLQFEELINRPSLLKYDIFELKNAESLKKAIIPDSASVDLALFPVWFLSYRKKDRVAYATVNGQTGKVVADLPVDTKKYILGSLLLAIPLFILLNLFFTLKPNWLLVIIALLMIICILISNVQVTNLLKRENGEADKGFFHRKVYSKNTDSNAMPSMMDYIPETSEEEANTRYTSNPHTYNKPNVIRNARPVGNVSNTGKTVYHVATTLNALFFLALFIFIIVYIFLNAPSWHSLLFPLGTALVAIFSIINSHLKRKSLLATDSFSIRSFFSDFREKLPYMVKPFLGLIIALAVLIINPVSDWIYYSCVLVCMGFILWTFADIIKRHNILSTHKLPQLNRRGGDEVA